MRERRWRKREKKEGGGKSEKWISHGQEGKRRRAERTAEMRKNKGKGWEKIKETERQPDTHVIKYT